MSAGFIWPVDFQLLLRCQVNRCFSGWKLHLLPLILLYLLSISSRRGEPLRCTFGSVQSLLSSRFCLSLLFPISSVFPARERDVSRPSSSWRFCIFEHISNMCWGEFRGFVSLLSSVSGWVAFASLMLRSGEGLQVSGVVQLVDCAAVSTCNVLMTSNWLSMTTLWAECCSSTHWFHLSSVF